jgi:hypothetical protein
MQRENMKTSIVSKTVLALVVFIGSSITATAAEGAKGEVAGYFGGSWVTDAGSHVAVGGEGGVNVVDRLNLFGEVNFIPMGQNGVSAHTVNFGGGAHINILPGTSSSKVQPYALGVAGVGHSAESYSYSDPWLSYNASASSNSFYFGFGGGMRCYIGRNWGVRPEFRYQRYTQHGGANSIAYTAGVFYQFGK